MTNFLFIAVESHLLQCDYSKVPCPTCYHLTKREVIEGHLHKQAKEASQRVAEREEAKAKIRELEDSLAVIKSEYEEVAEVFDYTYSYGVEESSISKLSRYICQNLDRGPSGRIDMLRLFNCIHRSYMRWKSCATLMLAATAYASNWFTEKQDAKLRDWMQSLAAAKSLRS